VCPAVAVNRPGAFSAQGNEPRWAIVNTREMLNRGYLKGMLATQFRKVRLPMI
jgi:hypothetical protein